MHNCLHILALFLSPIIALLVADFIHNKGQKRKDRLDVFRVLMVSRENYSNMDYVKAVNSIDVVFSDKPEVRNAWKNLRVSYQDTQFNSQTIRDNQTTLLEKMAEAQGYKSQITWKDITASYRPNWIDEEANFRELQKKATELIIENNS